MNLDNYTHNKQPAHSQAVILHGHDDNGGSNQEVWRKTCLTAPQCVYILNMGPVWDSPPKSNGIISDWFRAEAWRWQVKCFCCSHFPSLPPRSELCQPCSHRLCKPFPPNLSLPSITSDVCFVPAQQQQQQQPIPTHSLLSEQLLMDVLLLTAARGLIWGKNVYVAAD